MNSRDQYTIRFPSGKDDVCAVFKIDTIDEPFVLRDIVVSSCMYTMSFYAKSDGVGSMTIGGKELTIDTEWKRYVVTFITDSVDVSIYFDTTGTYYLYNTQLEIGSKDTDFALNPEDTEIALDEQTRRVVSIEANIDGITNRVTMTEADLTSVDKRVTVAESTLALHGDEINLRVKKDGVISSINQSAEEVKISAAKITLEGATIADSFTATNLHITGNSVFDGMLNGATGNFSGAITATSGKIGGFTIRGQDLEGDNISIFSGTTLNGGYIMIGGSELPYTHTWFGGTGVIFSDELTGNAFGSLRINGPPYVSCMYTALTLSRVDDDTHAVTNTINISGYNGSIVAMGPIMSNGVIQCDGGFKIGSTSYMNGYMELFAATPFIDFHFNNSIADYTSRIIEATSGRLHVSNRLSVGDYANDSYALSTSSMICNGIINCHVAQAVEFQTFHSSGQQWSIGGGAGTGDGAKFGFWAANAGTVAYITTGGYLVVGGGVNAAVVTESGIYRKSVGSSNVDGNKCAVLKTGVNSSGTYYFTLSGQWGTAGAGFTNKTFTATTSDVRLKDNIVDSEINALSVIDQIRIREFDWKESGVHQKIGFVADELELIDSALAIGGGWDEDGNIDAKGVNEFYLVGYLTKGIQELHSTQIEQSDTLLTLESRQDEQQIIIDMQADKIAVLEKRIKELEKSIA